MAASHRPIYTVCVAMCASMAAWVHSYGVKRFAFPHAVFMFHRANVSIDDDLSHITERVIVLTRICAEYDAHLAKLTHLSVAEVQARENAQWWLLPVDAIKNHLIDGVILSANYPAK